jgi:hypothetical protein
LTKDEIKILIENIPMNYWICLVLLPGRTKHSIVGKAFAMKSKLFHDSGRSGRICSGKEIDLKPDL